MQQITQPTKECNKNISMDTLSSGRVRDYVDCYRHLYSTLSRENGLSDTADEFVNLQILQKKVWNIGSLTYGKTK